MLLFCGAARSDSDAISDDGFPADAPASELSNTCGMSSVAMSCLFATAAGGDPVIAVVRMAKALEFCAACRPLHGQDA